LSENYVTGTFGELTENAVLRFQGAYGISQTGTAAVKTLEKLNSLVDITKIDSTRVYRAGDEDAGVKALQQRLCNLGFLDSKYVTGYYGAITVSAVKRFQKANSLPQTGTVAELTVKAINSTEAKTSTTTNTSDIIAKPGTLRMGDSGTQVKSSIEQGFSQGSLSYTVQENF
jgi:peptidoglycan hydrolase-like protein with peptidoglycan-binding domain